MSYKTSQEISQNTSQEKREKIARRIAKEVLDGYVVNLGIGIPTLVAKFIPKDINVMLQSENGLLGMGAFPLEEEVDPDLINAGKQTVTNVQGSSFFSSTESFSMIRGGHIDLTVLGAMQVDEEGSLANWMIPKKVLKGMGGAMDLVAGAKRVIVAMTHTNQKGESKLLKQCTLPLTGLNAVHQIVTDLSVIEVKEKSFLLKEIAHGVTKEDVIKKTEAPLQIASHLTYF